jgi:hypothetical protein
MMPAWRPDGRALYYHAGDGSVTEVLVTRTGNVLNAGAPTPLFRVRMQRGGTLPMRNFAVARGGDQFLVNELPDDVRTSSISLIVNWQHGEDPQR